MYLTQIQVKRDLFTENRGIKSSFLSPHYSIVTKNYVNIVKFLPLDEKSNNIGTYWQRQCNDFNCVGFGVTNKLFPTMVISPRPVHGEILDTLMGFKNDVFLWCPTVDQ